MNFINEELNGFQPEFHSRTLSPANLASCDLAHVNFSLSYSPRPSSPLCYSTTLIFSSSRLPSIYLFSNHGIIFPCSYFYRIFHGSLGYRTCSPVSLRFRRHWATFLPLIAHTNCSLSPPLPPRTRSRSKSPIPPI